MNQAVECYRCWRSQWRATGRTVRNHRGLLRAELVCEAPGCGYRFFSGRPAALAAAEQVSTGVENRVEIQEGPIRGASETTNSDFKKAQAGDQ